MKIDLSYNRIVADTMTEGFRAAFLARVPELVAAAFPSAVSAVMYEDYIADNFLFEGKWYYPLTVRDGEGAHTLWLVWPFDKDRFSSRSPYSYVGDEELEIAAADEVPEEFSLALTHRAIDAPEGVIGLKVCAAVNDALILVGKYSQSFVDELRRQITPAIEKAAGVVGLAESPLELELVFAPGTYMEHTSENVTYRRLLLVDGASAPRDFWVKWTRVGTGAAYTISDNVSSGEIVFELGEDAPQKIREKEYRFLCSSNPNKYRAAMGKRTVTEWRDVIKRAIRRGELEKAVFELGREEREEVAAAVPVGAPVTEAPVRDAELEEGLARVLGISEVPVAEPVTEATESYDDLNDMLRRVLVSTEGRATATEEAFAIDMPEEPLFTIDAEAEAEPLAETEVESPEEPVFVVEPEVVDVLEEVAETVTEDLVEADTEAEQDDEEIIVAEETQLPIFAKPEIEEELEEAEAEVEEIIEEEIEEEAEVEITAEEDREEELEEDIEEETLVEVDTEAAPVTVAISEGELYEEIERLREAQLRDKIIADARIEAEMRARASLEAEAELLRQERERLMRENGRLLALLGEANAKCDAALEELRLESERARRAEDMLRREIEARDREEARERDRIAEAARISIEEQRRLEEEALRREEEARLEQERIARERAAEEVRRQEEARRATVTAPVTPAIAVTPPVQQTMDDFMSKRVKIIFRQPVDFSIMGKIKEAIERTLVSAGKSDVPIFMKAYPEDNDIITLHITKMPKSEYDLLIAIVKAIGNAKIGVTKILLE